MVCGEIMTEILKDSFRLAIYFTPPWRPALSALRFVARANDDPSRDRFFVVRALMGHLVTLPFPQFAVSALASKAVADKRAPIVEVRTTAWASESASLPTCDNHREHISE